LLIIILVSLVRAAAPLSDNFNEIANFSAVGAIALFGGAYFNNSAKALGFPLLLLLLSDIFIAQSSGFGFFYGGWYWTYIAFICMVLVSRFIIKKVAVHSLITALFATVFVHWIVSDIGAMYVPGLYEPTLAGYWLCLMNAIPFELKFLYGTAIYGLVMFGTFELLKAKYPYLNLAQKATVNA
jgi:hypothetical protein